MKVLNMNEEPKDHHFIPVFYLKKWCNKNSQIIEYSRPHKNVITLIKYPTSTGFKRSLYSLDGVPEDQKQIVETGYMTPVIDTPAANALKILIERDKIKLTEKVRSDWTRFLIASLCRTPAALQVITQTLTEVMKKNLTDNLDLYPHLQDSDSSTQFDYVQKNNPHFSNNASKQLLIDVVDDQRIGDAIMNMRWSTLDLRNSNHDLLTSDFPTLRTTGVGNSNCLIFTPLSPRFLFIATPSEDVESTFLAYNKIAIVKWANDNIVRGAKQYVYGCSKLHHRFVENRLCYKESNHQSSI